MLDFLFRHRYLFGFLLFFVLLSLCAGFYFYQDREEDAEKKHYLELADKAYRDYAYISSLGDKETEASNSSAYQLFKKKVNFALYYFGDEALLGEGTTTDRDNCYRLLTKATLIEKYGYGETVQPLPGRCCNLPSDASDPLVAPSFFKGDRDIRGSFSRSRLYRLMLFAPGTGVPAATPEGDYTGEFKTDCERFLRNSKTAQPKMEILMIVGHADSDEQEEAMIALAAYYDMVLVNMKQSFAIQEDPSILFNSNGTLSEAGHALYAKKIVEAIDAAVEAEKPLTVLPTQSLYLN